MMRGLSGRGGETRINGCDGVLFWYCQSIGLGVTLCSDLEDFYLAEARARKNRKTIALDDVERQLGLGR